MPMLCQRCHIASKHPASIYDKDEITVNKSNRMFGRSCVNCHSNVHGSNHPSGSVLHALGDTVMRAVHSRSHPGIGAAAVGSGLRSAAGARTCATRDTCRHAPAAAAPLDDTRSLFDPTWRQFQIGGRLSSVEGDPARWQRYRDLRDGVLFTNARYEHVWAATGQLFQVAADNVGWRDGRYVGVIERQGRFAITGSWDGIPQFYSVDTKTPYTGDGATLTLDDATQRSIQNGQSTLSAYVPQAPQFDLIERRDTGTRRRHHQPDHAAATDDLVQDPETCRRAAVGRKLRVQQRCRSRAALHVAHERLQPRRGMEKSAEHAARRLRRLVVQQQRRHARLGQPASPRRRARTSPGRGRMSLWPTNQAQTFSVAGSSKLAARTQVTGFVSYGVWSNDSALQPFTINSQLPVIALPRATTQAEAHVFSTNVGIVSRPGG